MRTVLTRNKMGMKRRTSAQLVLHFHVLLRGHAEEGGDTVAVCVSICEAACGHAARRLGGGREVGVCRHDDGLCVQAGSQEDNREGVSGIPEDVEAIGRRLLGGRGQRGSVKEREMDS